MSCQLLVECLARSTIGEISEQVCVTKPGPNTPKLAVAVIPAKIRPESQPVGFWSSPVASPIDDTGHQHPESYDLNCDVDNLSAFEAIAFDILSAPKFAAQTLEWKDGPNESRRFSVDVYTVDGEYELKLSGYVNRVGEWSFILALHGSIQLLRGCSKGGHAAPGYHGVRHPTFKPTEPIHEPDVSLVGATPAQALQHFCHRANIDYQAQMDFGESWT
jgi:hypothetical protein